MEPGVIILIIVGIILLSGIRIAQEYQRGVVFRLGRFTKVKGPGIYYLIPIIEWQRLIDIRTSTVSIEMQETITKDSVTIKVNAVIWYKVVAPELAVIAVKSFEQAVLQMALTSLRNIIGQHGLDQVLKDRDSINEALRTIVDKASEPWGVKIEVVEMKDVEMPEAMQRAMAREAEAVREKRARIIKAEAEQESSIKLCEGAKMMAEYPFALELRRMQMISEVGAEHNSTTILMIPSEMVTLAKQIVEKTAG